VHDAFAYIAASPGIAASAVPIVVLGSVVQFGLGMGFGLTAAPLLALIDPQLVPAPTLWLALLTTTWGAWVERNAIVWREVGFAVLGRTCGVALATGILILVPDRGAFSLVFGTLIVVSVLLSVSGWHLQFSVPVLMAMSAISGLTATFTSVGAPPMAIAYQHRPANEARPTLAALFAVGCVISLAVLHATGWAGWHDIALVVVMMPGAIVGYFVARRIGRRLDRRYRPMLLTVSGCAGVVLVLRSLLG